MKGGVERRYATRRARKTPGGFMFKTNSGPAARLPEMPAFDKGEVRERVAIKANYADQAILHQRKKSRVTRWREDEHLAGGYLHMPLDARTQEQKQA